MIKRLKWNVLHGGGGGEESDGGLSSSDDSEAGDPAAANALLAELVANDDALMSDLKTAHDARKSNIQDGDDECAPHQDINDTEDGSNGHSAKRGRKRFRKYQESESSDDEDAQTLDDDRSEDDSSSKSDSAQEGDASDEQVSSQPDEVSGDDDTKDDAKHRKTWHECGICPGKRFLNEREVRDHLNSKGHGRALARLEASAANSAPTRARSRDPKKMNWNREYVQSSNPSVTIPAGESSGTPSTPRDDDAEERLRKRKAAVKRKLKMKKQRKWEREQRERAGQSTLAVTSIPLKETKKYELDNGIASGRKLYREGGVVSKPKRTKSKKMKTG